MKIADRRVRGNAVVLVVTFAAMGLYVAVGAQAPSTPLGAGQDAPR